MPAFWQIVQARATQSQGVWNLQPAFTFGLATRASHADAMSDLTAAVEAMDTAEGAADDAHTVLATDYATLRDTSKRALARFDSELDESDGLKDDLDALGAIRQDAPADIERRAEKTIAFWKRVNAARAALNPPRPEIKVKLRTAAQHETLYDGLAPRKKTLAEQTSAFTGTRNDTRQKARDLDALNKRFYKAWGSEFEEGSDELAALADVDTEESTAPPEVLEIAAITPQGLSLKVSYIPDTGRHATVKNLLWKVEGVHVDYKRVAADVAQGNVLGPFLIGQIVHIRTDVGNSRDFSELSPEQVLTIA